ncbi:TPA: hypothetical protein ACWXAD_004901 [Klebsiella quasipneumoniae subsp. similipneumoniae]
MDKNSWISKMANKALLVIAALMLCSCDDPPKPLTDMDIVTCDVSTMLNNKDAVSGMSASDMLDECSAIASITGRQPTFGLLRDVSKGWLAFHSKGYEGGAGDLTAKVLKITDLRGQLNGSDDRIMNNYNIIYKMYAAWDKDITPDDVIAFLEGSGVVAKSISDDGLVKMMAIQR